MLRIFARRSFSTEVPHFPAKSILPSGHRQVRILNNTTRDAQQSNLSAEMADDHRQEIGKLIDAVYKDMKTPRGYEQIWGGTVPMFDIWKRGVQPFDELRTMKRNMPNTPASALIRSNALNAMSNQPRDVVDAFILAAQRAGVDVFTNFCAHNDWRNHVAVAEAVHKAGAHYQGCVSWAVYNKDPTIYNAQWAVDLCRELVKLGAHSLYIKDPSGVLTPDMAAILAGQLKEAFPDLPLVFHTHYQTGYAYMTYLKAVEYGANGVECSLGFADGNGQPYGLTLLRTFEEMGFDTGNPNKAAMQKINDYSNSIRMLYAQGRAVRTPDIRVEETGIAGGQRSILDKELIDAGQAHLIPKVDVMVQEVRDEGGKVCQVTPVADAYAREAMRRIRTGETTKNFTPGYAAILIGEGGLVKEPVDPVRQKQALLERSLAHVKALEDKKAISAATAKGLTLVAVPELRKHMDELAEATLIEGRLSEVESRIRQLTTLKGKTAVLENLNHKIARAGAVDASGRPIQNVDDRLRILKEETENLRKQLKQVKQVSQKDYEALLFQRGSDSQYSSILSACPQLSALVKSGDLKQQDFRSLVANSGFISCCAGDFLPPGMDKARKAVEALDKEFLIGLTLDSKELAWESTILQATYEKTAVSGMITNFFKNYRENPGFWAKLYDQPKATGKEKPKPEGLLKRSIHVRARQLMGEQLFQDLTSLNSEIQLLAARLENIDKVWIPKGSVGVPTREAVNAKLGELKRKASDLRSQAIEKISAYIRQNDGALSPAIATGEGIGGVVFRRPTLEIQLKQVDRVVDELMKLES